MGEVCDKLENFWPVRQGARAILVRFVTENNNFSQNVEYFRKFPAKVSEKSQPDSPDQAGRFDVFFVCVRPTVCD